MRLGEICAKEAEAGDQTSDLNCQDVAVDNLADPKLIQLLLRKFKTNVFRQGAKIHLGRTDDNLCPVAALLSWMIQRGNHPGPLFTFASGRALTHPTLVMRLREALSEAGFNPQGFSRHSFQAGAATTAALRGLEDSCIKQLGHWKSTAYLRYVPHHVAALSRVLSSRTVRSHHHDQEQLRSHSITGQSRDITIN